MKKYFLLSLLAISFSCFAQNKHVIADDHAKLREITPFETILVKGPFTVHYSMGNEYQLAISATDESTLARIMTKVVGKQLEISLDGNSWKNWSSKSKFTVYISSPLLKRIVASGAVDFDVHDIIQSENLDLVFSGASEFSGNLDAHKMSAVFSGGSDMKVKGSVGNLSLVMSGASDCRCMDLMADTADIVVSGASDVKITVLKSIKATASGASDVEYIGSPVSIQTRASGASSINKKGS